MVRQSFVITFNLKLKANGDLKPKRNKKNVTK